MTAPEPQSRRCLIPGEHGMSHCWCSVPAHRPAPVDALLAEGHTFTWERDVTGGWFALIRNAEGFIIENGLGPAKAGALAHLAERLERRGVTGAPRVPAVHGPFETEQQARAAAHQAVAPEPGWSILRAAGNRELLRRAITDAGLTTGAFDERIIDWLAGFEDSACAVIAGLIARAAETAPDGSR